MRKGIKVLSVLMLMCVMFSLTACGAAKIVGTWAQKAEQPGTPNQRTEHTREPAAPSIWALAAFMQRKANMNITFRRAYSCFILNFRTA